MLTSTTTPYRDRQAGGQCLAQELACYAGLENVVILGIPRGGVLVAAEVARALQVPLDVFVVRKISLPDGGNTCVGTMASGGVCVLSQDVLHASEFDPYLLADAVSRVRDQVLAYEALYRRGRSGLELKNENVILVDDGAGSGRTLRAAIAAIRSYSPASISVAVPVASPACLERLKTEADEVICPFAPDPFYSVGLAYDHFPDVADELITDSVQQAGAEMIEFAHSGLRSELEL